MLPVGLRTHCFLCSLQTIKGAMDVRVQNKVVEHSTGTAVVMSWNPAEAG